MRQEQVRKATWGAGGGVRDTHRAGAGSNLRRGLVTCALITGWAGWALGQDAPPAPELMPIRVRLNAEPACATLTVFEQQVFIRTSKARRATPGEFARTFEVEITRDEQGSRGQLRIPGAEGGQAERVVEGATCEEVVSALALVVALTLDPQATVFTPDATVNAPAAALPPSATATDISPSATATDLPPSATATVARPDTSSREQPGALPPTELSMRPRGTPIPERRAEPRTAPSIPPTHGDAAGQKPLPPGPRGWGVGAAAMATRGITPRWLPALHVHGDLVLDESGLWSPEVRLGLVAARGTFDHQFTSVDATWLAGRAEGCPVRVTLLPSVTARPCALVDVGTLTMKAVRTEEFSPRADTRLWLAAGAALRLDVRVRGPLFVEAGGGFVVPFTAYRYTFHELESGSRVPAHEVPPLAGFGFGGVKLEFP